MCDLLNVISDVEEDYPLVSGRWDIVFKDLETHETYIMSYLIKTTIPIKSLYKDGLQILSAKRMR